MDQITLFTGFATLAGLLAGYFLARRGRVKLMLAVWAFTALAVFVYPMWLDAGEGLGGPDAAVILYIVLIPFAVGLVVGSVFGALMRVVFGRGERT